MVCGEEMEGNLTKGPILKTLTKLAIPIMASSFLGTLYNLTEECSIDSDIIITAPIYEELNRLIIETNTDSQKLLQSENINCNLIDITKKQAFILMEKLLDKKRKLNKK